MQKSVVTIFVITAVLLSGCTGLLGQSGPSISEPRSDVVDGQPVLVFNYSVDDYSEVLMENPDGDVVARGTIEPNQSSAGFYMSAPRSGTYKLILQEGGETATEREINFSGSDPTVKSVETDWSGNTLQRVSLTVRNDGDLPARISDPIVEIQGNSVQLDTTKWIPPNQTETVSVTPGYNDLQVNQPGDVRGSVVVSTQDGEISGNFQQTFEPPNLTVESVDATWEGATLRSARITVTNTGDLPTTGHALVTNGGSELASTWNESLPPGESVEFEVQGLSIYEHSSPGTVELSAVVTSPDGFAEKRFTHTAEPANLTLESASTTWEGSDLTSVEYTVRNSGDLQADFDVTLSVRGSTVAEGSRMIDGQATETFAVVTLGLSDTLYSAQQGGDVPVEVVIDGPENTDSLEKSAEFEGVQTEISSVDPWFIDQIQSDNVDLSSISFSVRNTGDVQVRYDTVRLSMDGVSQSQSLTFETAISPGSSESHTVYLDDDLTVSPGDHDLTIDLRNGGTSVASTTTSVSAEG